MDKAQIIEKLRIMAENIRSKIPERKIKLPRSILITGASSGIGAMLAVLYSGRGVQLYLCGRDATRLSRVALECLQRGARVETQVVDVVDDINMSRWIASLPRLDLVVVNAGISGGAMEGVDDDVVREIFSVNIGGALNTILPAISKMREQQVIDGQRGQIAIMASLAGVKGLPSSPAYSASKNCMVAYGDALRGSLHADKIRVSVIMPGYIRTPLTDKNNFAMPLLMEPQKAAEKIIIGLSRNKKRIVFPKVLYFILKTIAFMPVFITDPILRKLPKK